MRLSVLRLESVEGSKTLRRSQAEQARLRSNYAAKRREKDREADVRERDKDAAQKKAQVEREKQAREQEARCRERQARFARRREDRARAERSGSTTREELGDIDRALSRILCELRTVTSEPWHI